MAKNYLTTFLLLCLTVVIPGAGSDAQVFGQPFHWTLLPNGQTPCVQDFEDFVAFAVAFGSQSGDAKFDHRADFVDDGTIDFRDFLSFAGEFNQNLCPTRYFVVGRVVLPESEVKDVAVERVVDGSGSRATTYIGSDGHFRLIEAAGSYRVSPLKFGLAFTPSALDVEISDADVLLEDIHARRLFTPLEVKALRDNEPIADAEIIIANQAGQTAVASGITDPSGMAAIRVPTVDGEMEGSYQATLIDQSTDTVLGTWNDIPIQVDDRRRLLLQIDSTALYIPEREYSYYARGEKQVLAPSDRSVRVTFRPDTSSAEVDSVISALGLERSSSFFDFSSGTEHLMLVNTLGHGAVVEVLNRLKRSGLVLSALPDFGSYGSEGGSAFVPGSKLTVKFTSTATESEISVLNDSAHTALARQNEEGANELEIRDLLSQDIFEVAELYRVHPLVDSVSIDYRAIRYLY